MRSKWPLGRAVLVCALALACGGVRAEDTPEAILARGRQLYTEQGPQAAMPLYEQALELFRKLGDRRGEAIVLGYIGNCHKQFGDLPKALDFLTRALQIKREIHDRQEGGKTLTHLGLVYWEMGDYRKAVNVLTESIAVARELQDPQLEAAALNNLSLVYDEQGDYRRSLEQYQQALQLHRAAKYQAGESATLGNIGGVYLLLGQFREALRYYQQALSISESLKLKAYASKDLGNIALCQLGLGEVEAALSSFDRALSLAAQAGIKKEEADWRKGKGEALFRIGRYSAAIEEYKKALDIYERAGLRREWMEGLNDLGSAHVSLGDVTSAQNEFRRARDIAREIGHSRGVTFNLISLGNLEWRQKKFEAAAALYNDALGRARSSDDRLHLVVSLIQLALTEVELGRFDAALLAGEEALKVARAEGMRGEEAAALHALGEAERGRGDPRKAIERYRAGEDIVRTAGDPEIGWRLAYGRGQVLEKAGPLEDAVAAYRRAIEVIESVRSQLVEERYRAGYIEDKYQVYVALVRLLLKLDRPKEAFFFSEKLRARSYLDLLNRAEPPIHDPAQRPMESELRARIRKLQQAIERESTRPVSERRGEALDLYSRELAAAERAYEDFLDDLRRSLPEYAAARALEVPPSESVQGSLAPGTALIEYVIGGEHVTIFVLTREKLFATSVPARALDLEAKVTLFRDLILNVNSEGWRKPAASLRQILLDPVEQAGWLEGIRRLYVVPHGVLHYLPFAVLPRNASAGAPYLLEDYSISSLPAAASLVNGHTAGNPERTLLALAPERARLRFAQQEAQEIGQHFPAPRVVLLGTRATEEAFKRGAGNYRVIHLATHGTFNRLNPLLSGVELEPSRSEDGLLQVHEILGLKLQAQIVALSACETALGSGYFTEIPPGDDFVGLTRAFLFAGSKSVLASLWEVDDRSTLRLMSDFYRHLAPANPAEALAAAQRDLIRRGGLYRHPYHWAPFVLVGMTH